MSAVLALRARMRFALWAARARLQLRRAGGRLEVHGRARFDGPPRLVVGAPGTLVLRFAEGVRLGRDLHLEVDGGGELELGSGVYFQHAARVVLRGGSIALGAHTHVRDGAVLKSAGLLRVGEEVTIGAFDTLACVRRVEVGDRSGLGERVSLTDSDHTHDGSGTHYLRQPLKVGEVVLGTNVLVSAGVVIVRDAHVGDNAVIAANAVVIAGEHPAGHLLAGAPARALRALP
jgi:carbonic anhydrase/acetyltransferase-like protein (isoleucine patch superfamily)